MLRHSPHGTQTMSTQAVLQEAHRGTASYFNFCEIPHELLVQGSSVSVIQKYHVIIIVEQEMRDLVSVRGVIGLGCNFQKLYSDRERYQSPEN